MSALFKRTLVPVDGSALAESALDEISSHLVSGDDEVLLVMVMDGHVDNALSDFAHAESISVVEAAESYLDDVRLRLAQVGVKAESRLVFDPNAAQGILDTAEAEDVSLIVLASHGRSGVGRWLLGSVAQKVVQSAHAPTLVVRAR